MAISVEATDEFVTATSADGRHLKTSIEGYVTEFGNKEHVISVANARNMLYVEELREKGEEENWEEKFKTHKGQIKLFNHLFNLIIPDSRPRGPESVSMDLTFADSRHLYGLPEHTDSFVLANTLGKEFISKCFLLELIFLIRNATSIYAIIDD